MREHASSIASSSSDSTHDAAALTDANFLYWIDFGQATPALNHQVTMGGLGLGAAVDVSAGDLFAFVATSSPNRVSRLVTPTLANLASSPILLGTPVAIGGTEQDLFVVVAESGANRLDAFFPLSLANVAATANLTGIPTAMVVRTLGPDELVWVATRSPNTVRLFRLTTVGFAPIASVALGAAEPIGLRVGLAGAGDPDEGTLSGFVHVLVRQ